MTTYLYVSLQREDRIAQYTLDPANGALQHQADYTLAGMPAPMAVDPQQRFMFVGRRKPGEFGLSGFRIRPADGSLEPVNHIPLDGDPVHLSTDRSGRYLLSAYYYQARVGVHGFNADGALDASPIEWRETGIGAHYVQTDPANRYAFVPHIAAGNHTGVNAIFQFRFYQESGHLAPNSPDRVIPNEPEGPRHFMFQSQPGRAVFVQRTGLQHHRLPIQPGRRHAGAVPNRAYAARRLRRPQFLLSDSDNPGWPLPVRAQPRPTTASPPSPLTKPTVA